MKKTYLIAMVFIILIVIAVTFWVFFNKKKNQPSGSDGQAVENLPVELPQESSILVENANDTEQIKNSYKEYTEQDAKSFPDYINNGISQAFTVDDGKGNILDLKIFLESIDARVNQKLATMIGENYYGFFYCPNEYGKKDFGVTFELGDSDSQKIESINSEAKEAMRQWEPYMLKDLRNVLFPEENFTEEQLNQVLVFKEGEFRYTEVSLPGEKKSSINYVVDIYPPDHPSSTTSVYISTSKDCLRKSLNSLFDF